MVFGISRTKYKTWTAGPLGPGEPLDPWMNWVDFPPAQEYAERYIKREGAMTVAIYKKWFGGEAAVVIYRKSKEGKITVEYPVSYFGSTSVSLGFRPKTNFEVVDPKSY